MTTENMPGQPGPAEPGEAARQRAVDALGLLDTPPEERFDRITRLSIRIFGVPTARRANECPAAGRLQSPGRTAAAITG